VTVVLKKVVHVSPDDVFISAAVFDSFEALPFERALDELKGYGTPEYHTSISLMICTV
jgi:hypothetical protein